MKTIKIEDDKYIILFHNKYYVVNKFTYKLIDAYVHTNNISELSNNLNLKNKQTIQVYSELNEQINNCSYYNNNLDLIHPLKIQWKITPYCNLKCKHCYLGNTNPSPSLERINKIAEQIIASNVFEVTITGGEALTVPNLNEIVEKFISNKIHVLIYTNAILLKSFIDKIDGLVEKEYLKFSVSIDGTKEVHDDIRGFGTYDKTIDSIKYALEKGYNVITNSVLSTLNYRTLPDLYVILNNLGVKEIQISNLIVMGRATSKMKLSHEQIEEFNELLQNVLNQNNLSSQLFYASMPETPEDRSQVYAINRTNYKLVGYDSWKCGAGIGKATIDHIGNVYCCPFMKNSLLGNVLQTSLSQCWDSVKRYEFLKLLAKNNNNSRLCIVAQKAHSN